ncbi:sensor histidine kinase [Anaerocolumna sp. MB42-C2]|uniref:sensor histidine kinase n=1 Tax=Anaerocolumna sp. MB42-C2 TaxID=3070997 RepID=UPI0027DF4F9E|nr:sensor histidine kinase [Anaerocolumna sp. MB42-C2]WMJ89543.1 ATP-binding protein [Anaerocolumna sp. MB42-C2]
MLKNYYLSTACFLIMCLINNSFISLASLQIGPWYISYIIYFSFVIVICFVTFWIIYLKAGKFLRKQIIILGIGICNSWILNIIYIWNSTELSLFLTLAGLTITGILIIWVFYQIKHNVSTITPIEVDKILESISDGAVVFNEKNQIILYNKPACILIPELKEITPRNNDIELIFTSYPVVIETLKSNELREIQFHVPKEDIVRIYKMKLTFINNEKTYLGKIMILSDITTSKKNLEDLTSTSAQLETLNTLKDRLINIVAYDIREPLDMLINLTDILDKQELNQLDNKLLVREIQKQVKNIFLIVDSMLEYFQSKQTSNIYLPMKWKLAMLVQDTVNSIKIKADHKNINIKASIQEDLFVYADKGMLQIVLRNLLSNAVKFTNRNGKIVITAQKENDYVIISVRDTGIGMESEKVQLLFQDVECTPSIGTEGELGIGLGLLFCRQIIQRNHGDIWVDSTLDEGSNFYISVPTGNEWCR